jgi:hypothetical protein
MTTHERCSQLAITVQIAIAQCTHELTLVRLACVLQQTDLTGAQDREERLRAQREAALQSSKPTFTPAITAKGRTGGRSASVSTFERLHEDPMKEERR